MIRINLLPVRAARKKENIRQQVSMFFLFVVFVLCVMGYLTISMNRTISGLNGKIEVAQEELTKYQAIEKQVVKIKKELQKLEEKMDIIAQLEANRSGPVRFMDALTGLVLPDKMWLTTLSQTAGKMKMTGVATDNKTIADFMSRLETSTCFRAVDLISSKQVKQQDKKLKAFTITCEVSNTRPDKAMKAS
jgi:type IV pilus assembly protein PilN